MRANAAAATVDPFCIVGTLPIGNDAPRATGKHGERSSFPDSVVSAQALSPRTSGCRAANAAASVRLRASILVRMLLT